MTRVSQGTELLHRVEVRSKGYGFINTSGQVVVEPRFRNADDFEEGLARVSVETTPGKEAYGFIDATGRMVVEARYRDAGHFAEGLASAQSIDTGKWGFIDKSGSWTIEPLFRRVFPFSEDLAAARLAYGILGLRTKWVFIDKSGRIVVEAKAGHVGWYAEGRAPIELGSKVGFVDLQGHIAIDRTFANAQPFSDGLAAVLVGRRDFTGQATGQWGFVDRDGNVAIPARFDAVARPRTAEERAWGWQLSNATYQIDEVNKRVRFNLEGMRVLEPTPREGYGFCGGIAAAAAATKWGFVDKTGEFVIEPQFEWADSFSEGLAAVQIKHTVSSVYGLNRELGSWTYVTKSGERAFGGRVFRMGSPFRGGLAYVGEESTEGYINLAGEFVWQRKTGGFE